MTAALWFAVRVTLGFTGTCPSFLWRFVPVCKTATLGKISWMRLQEGPSQRYELLKLFKTKYPQIPPYQPSLGGYKAEVVQYRDLLK